jgi:hypothetical protein
LMVDPDDLLIFKLRGKAKQAPAAERPAVAVQAVKPPEPVRQQQASAPVAAAAINAGANQAVQQAPAERVATSEVLNERRYTYIREDQAQVPFPMTAKPETADREGVKGLSYIAGTIFAVSAVIFGYLIYPQSLFLVSYVSKVGLLGFLGAINYDYGISAVNVALVALSAACGALMFASPEKAHKLSGVVSSAVILIATFEYLNSNSSNLIVVIVLAFFEIGILAYVSMTASSRSVEAEDLRPDELLWPRAETF